MNKGDLIVELTKLYPNFNKQDIGVMVDTFFDSIVEALARGERVELRGFGTFGVKERQGRTARNPRSGRIVTVPAKRVPFFRVAKELRAEVNKETACTSGSEASREG